MAEQTPKKKKSCSGWLLGCGFGLILFVALILFAGAIGYVLTRNTLARTPLVTTISMPQNQEQAEVNLQLPIQASANYSEGVARVEVYADGALVLAQDAAEEGATSLSVTGTWTPLTAGSHILTARGYGSDETFADSSIVNVIVTEPPDNVIIDMDSIEKEPGTQSQPGRYRQRLRYDPRGAGQAQSWALRHQPHRPIALRHPHRRTPPAGDLIPTITCLTSFILTASPPSGTPAAPTNLAATATCTNSHAHLDGQSG